MSFDKNEIIECINNPVLPGTHPIPGQRYRVVKHYPLAKAYVIQHLDRSPIYFIWDEIFFRRVRSRKDVWK